jgi:hypothetical protein
MRRAASAAVWLIAVSLACPWAAATQPLASPPVARSAPFTATLSNHTPLVFGMDVEDVSRALGQPLSYVSGRPGDEIYLAIRDTSGIFLFSRRDPLYLQFRRGRLTGWKGASGYILPWWQW